MYATTVDLPVVSEKIWLAWAHKGKLHDQKIVRRLKWAGGVVLVLLALGWAFYLLAGS